MSILPHRKGAVGALLLALCLLGACAAPMAEETVAPTPIPTPSPEVVTELWGFPIDDTHDAFEVPTGGRLGTVLVTVEAGEEVPGGLCHCVFSVWDTADLTTPLQTFEGLQTVWEDRLYCVVFPQDVNFDGYEDLCYTYSGNAEDSALGLYLWDEPQARYVFAKEFPCDGALRLNEEEQTVEYGNSASGMLETCRWENGELVCFRKSKSTLVDEEMQSYETVTYELIDGQWQEISRRTNAMQGL